MNIHSSMSDKFYLWQLGKGSSRENPAGCFSFFECVYLSLFNKSVMEMMPQIFGITSAWVDTVMRWSQCFLFVSSSVLEQADTVQNRLLGS